jgi:NodT family efflux transporter outer membrane factor (OMF) lipoprotein
MALAGCAVPEPPAGAEAMPQSVRDKVPGAWSARHDGGEVAPDWIRTFGDPELTVLVTDAIERNPDLRAAAALVEASRHSVRVAASSLYPRLALKALAERQGLDLDGDLGRGIDPPDLGPLGVDTTGGAGQSTSLESSTRRSVYGLGLGASWELDVWGRVRSGAAAAVADTASLEADYAFARESLAATVARAYFSAIEAAQQEANAQESLSLYQEYAALTDQRREQGFASEFDVAQIRSRTAGATDAYVLAQAARAEATRAIEVFTSRYPAGELATRRSLPGSPRSVPSGLPSQILERRPDLVAAERRVAAAFYRVNEARTARLPRFAISGAGGLGSADLDGVGVLDGLSWSLAGGIIQPIFFGGELKAVQDIRTSEQEAAVARYVSSALAAFKDVEDALAADHFLRQRQDALEEMVSASAEALRLGRDQFDQGQADMFTILRLSGESLAAKIELTRVRSERLRERANLFLALGGNYSGAGPAKGPK